MCTFVCDITANDFICIFIFIFIMFLYGYNIITEHSVMMSPYLKWIVTHSKLIIKDSICH